MQTRQEQKQAAAAAAVALVQEGMTLGLGSGSTAELAIAGLAARLRDGLHFRGGVPTSERTAALARELGIPLLDLNDVAAIDLTIDGADEVDPALNLIKGAGGALTREKLVAHATRRQVIVVDAGKLVERLGAAFPVPVEVLPFAWTHAARSLAALGCTPAPRGGAVQPFTTDNGNYLLDCRFPGIDDPAALDAAIKALPGVVESGLFVGLTHTLIVGGPDGVEIRGRLPFP